MGWLNKRLGNHAQAADIAQDTFLRLLVRKVLLNPDCSRPYLLRVARGLVVDNYRRKRIEHAYLDSLRQLPEPLAPSPEQQALAVEALLELDQLLGSLPDKVRRALLLCKLDGLSYREIAEQMGVSVSSVEKYIMRGLAACCQLLIEDDL